MKTEDNKTADSKTNVIRILEAQNIEHEVFTYEVSDGLLDAITVAGKVGFDPDLVFKTLVTTGKNSGIYVFVIPGNCELDLKKAAQAAREKSIQMLKAKDLLSLTGYIHGGCSPIGMKKKFSTYIEEVASGYDDILVSAGKIGVQVKIKPADLIDLTGACFANLI
ncbi:ybaK/ebsC protein [Syntrophobotulus glycolicus DSM 8271]|uniref:Cys-tRNA(Pro)/Cys-tRNA(Cys) deacylase n=1 Tax=Syntrophobotulus glycolicus (strain DSM 8271 / FlGlyR) TaxID=645991 RepID=F0SYD7_SYNGF|nr:Cys-tRNA(Pro) deacylase [Syntrophobotulus glycolicus]ADY55972.1 ybaK/ebsC protein [Syntrophobotulus glycolicus DSM 8271]